MWLCHLCKSPSGSHRMLGDHPWAFLSPGVSVPSSGCWTIVYPWAGLSPGSLLSRGRNLGTVFHQHQAEVGSDNRSWPGPQFPKLLFRKSWVHFALFANYLQLKIHPCLRSSSAGLLLSQSLPVVNPALYRAFHLLSPVTFSSFPKVWFLQPLSAGGQVSHPNLESFARLQFCVSSRGKHQAV